MRVKLWETEENEMVHTPPKKLHTNQSIHVFFFFLFFFFFFLREKCFYWKSSVDRRRKDDRKQGKGIQGASTFLSNPSRGLPKDGLAGPGPARPKQGLEIPWETPGKEGGRRPGVPTQRMQ